MSRLKTQKYPGKKKTQIIMNRSHLIIKKNKPNVNK